MGISVPELLISAVNVGGLVLLRSEHRHRDIAVRNALGARSGRLIAQFATEALALAAASSALGLSTDANRATRRRMPIVVFISTLRGM